MLLDLPTECLVYILEILHMNDVISMRATCKDIAEIVKLVRSSHSLVNYLNYSDSIPYGFDNCRLLTNMVVHTRSVECMFDVLDICTFNGVKSLKVEGMASNSGPVYIDKLSTIRGNFININDNFRHLKSLKCGGHIEDLHDLYNLEELDLDVVSNIYNMPSLTSLNIINVNRLHNLPKLKHLHYKPSSKSFYTCNIGVVNETLETLCLVSRYNVDYDLTMYSFPKLKSIRAFQCRTLILPPIPTLECLYSDGVTDLSIFPNLKIADVSFSKVTDISMLHKLEILNIKHNTKLVALPKNNNIKHLTASLLPLGIDKVEVLNITHSPDLEIPDNNIITTLDASYSMLSNIDKLKYVTDLNIMYTDVTSIPPNNLIRVINITGTKITSIDNLINAEHIIAYDLRIKELPDFTRIKYLDINRTDVTQLGHYPTIEHLNISNTAITKVAHLTSLVKLLAFNVTLDDVDNLSHIRVLLCNQIMRNKNSKALLINKIIAENRDRCKRLFEPI